MSHHVGHARNDPSDYGGVFASQASPSIQAVQD